ncbi:MAG: HupE/UreJ family protein [Alphaproteobacteria bacterium]|nr:HupE/UreJ family protein [Alphaproteobacteria bacterium]
MVLSSAALAHGVDEGTKQFLLQNSGLQVIAFMYIGAKHMVTGYDHLLFLVGVIFFLYKSKDVLLYVTLFTIGHSLTLMTGVLNDISVNPYLIDAIIGISVVYKGFDNLGGFERTVGMRPDTRIMVLIFGLFHGFGLATKLQDFPLDEENLFGNMLSFNVGVELGQLSALMIILLLLAFWRRHESFSRFATITNFMLMSAGMMLIGYQLTGYFIA